MTRVPQIHCPNWNEFKRTLLDTLFDDGVFANENYLFRGVNDETWQLVSTFDRYARDVPLGERQAAAERLLSLFDHECNSDDASGSWPKANATQDDCIAVAQHHGLPTRALDWTDSPYVAAFFAFADLHSPSQSRPNHNVAVWALDSKHPIWNGRMGARIVRPDRHDDRRLLRQKGVLTYLEATQGTLEAYVGDSWDDCGDIPLRKFTVPYHQAAIALADLAAMGITATHLFPDLGGAARGAQIRYEIESDS